MIRTPQGLAITVCITLCLTGAVYAQQATNCAICEVPAERCKSVIAVRCDKHEKRITSAVREASALRSLDGPAGPSVV